MGNKYDSKTCEIGTRFFILSCLVPSLECIFWSKGKEMKQNTYVVYDIAFRVFFFGSLWVGWTDEINLVILKLIIPSIHVNNVVSVVDPESVDQKRKSKEKSC